MSAAAFGQEKKKAVEYLPDDHYFEPLILDPVEYQSSGALYAYWEESEFQHKIYTPLALGFQLPVVHWDKGDHGFEIDFAVAVFFQFEFNDITTRFLVNLINTDFKVGIPFIYRKNHFALRTTVYHVSSHFSEEFIFRNELTEFGENKNTYDALSVIGSWQFKKMRYYGGIDAAFNSPYNRGVWKFQAGLLFRTPIKKGSKFNYIAGADFQLLQETNWDLNTSLGAGIEIAMRPDRVFQLMIHYFAGNIPYSQYTQLDVQYLGATLIGHPF
jgi:hypothetical protein